ncbi:unnamed protein product [Arctia plantaginis]|uniref:C2H2-type domain-containing protein n=1 Tax=Arctia plantaginis TaxID=874455 RepID=A0A8S1A279_ARCPL|nr:unnamed protein product [Arctia plantaginis]
MESYYLVSNHTEDEFIQNGTRLDKICICCSSQNGYFINISTCKHTTFLRNIDKIKFKLQDAYVCFLCHTMLKKIEAFQQQIEETNTILTDRAYNMQINKIHKLHRSTINITDSTQLSQLAEVDDFEVKPEVYDIEVIEEDTDLHTEIKVERDSSDSEQKIRSPTKKKKKTKTGSTSKYEGKIRAVLLTLEELSEERQSMATQEKYVKLPYKCEDCIVGFDHELTWKAHLEQRHKMNHQERNDINAKYVILILTSCVSGPISLMQPMTPVIHSQHLMGLAGPGEDHSFLAGLLLKQPIFLFQHKGSFRCDICKSVLNSKSSYNEHTKRHIRRLECMACGKRYNHIQSAIQHYDEKHMPAGSSLQRAFECHCGFSTTVNRTFRYHQDKHKKKQQCTICGNTFVNTNTLKIHMFTVHQQSSRVYRCDACDKTYRAKSGLTSHLRSAHADAPRAYCAPCRTHYTSFYALQAHLNTHSRHITDTDKKFTCDECGAKFVKKCSLQVHINWEHLKLNTHRCPTCSKVFKSASAVRRHVSYVHNKERLPRNKICHYCGRGFTTQTILQSHLRTHTGERPLQCQHCRATFAHSGALYTHIKLKHIRNNK